VPLLWQEFLDNKPHIHIVWNDVGSFYYDYLGEQMKRKEIKHSNKAKKVLTLRLSTIEWLKEIIKGAEQ